jgi:hypothetical protein
MIGVSQNTAGGGCSAGSHAVEWPDILGGGDHDGAMSLSLLKFVWQASLVDEAMLPS